MQQRERLRHPIKLSRCRVRTTQPSPSSAAMRPEANASLARGPSPIGVGASRGGHGAHCKRRFFGQGFILADLVSLACSWCPVVGLGRRVGQENKIDGDAAPSAAHLQSGPRAGLELVPRTGVPKRISQWRSRASPGPEHPYVLGMSASKRKHWNLRPKPTFDFGSAFLTPCADIVRIGRLSLTARHLV